MFNIRHETEQDIELIRVVNRLAFGRDNETRLVDALRDGEHVRISLVAENDASVVGHVLFCDLKIITDTGIVPALALAPMAVLPMKSVGNATLTNRFRTTILTLFRFLIDKLPAEPNRLR